MMRMLDFGLFDFLGFLLTWQDFNPDTPWPGFTKGQQETVQFVLGIFSVYSLYKVFVNRARLRMPFFAYEDRKLQVMFPVVHMPDLYICGFIGLKTELNLMKKRQFTAGIKLQIHF